MSSRLDLLLLGEFRAEIDGGAVPRDAWRQGRAAALVKLLALSPRHHLSRERVIEALWPGVSPEAGGANVRKAVHFARRALGGNQAVAVRDGSVELWPSGQVTTDVDRFETATAWAFASTPRATRSASSRTTASGSGRGRPERRARSTGSPSSARRNAVYVTMKDGVSQPRAGGQAICDRLFLAPKIVEAPWP